jgi:hypothetical protein
MRLSDQVSALLIPETTSLDSDPGFVPASPIALAIGITTGIANPTAVTTTIVTTDMD